MSIKGLARRLPLRLRGGGGVDSSTYIHLIETSIYGIYGYTAYGIYGIYRGGVDVGIESSAMNWVRDFVNGKASIGARGWNSIQNRNK